MLVTISTKVSKVQLWNMKCNYALYRILCAVVGAYINNVKHICPSIPIVSSIQVCTINKSLVIYMDNNASIGKGVLLEVQSWNCYLFKSNTVCYLSLVT